MKKYKLALVDSFKEKEIQSFEIKEHQIAVVLLDGCFHAFANSCPHQYMPLDMGVIREGNIVCTLHGWRFDLKNGSCPTNPSCSLPIYKTEINEKQLYLIMEDE